MNQLTVSDYTYLLAHPDAINDARTYQLEAVLEKFPYFQSAMALRLKGLYNQNSFHYNQALKQIAAHTTERSVLFDFITSNSFTSIHKGLYEQKLAELMNIDVVESEIINLPPQNETGVNKLEQSILLSIREADAAKQEVIYEIVAADTDENNYSDANLKSLKEENTDFKEIVIASGDNLDRISAAEEKLEIGRPIVFNSNEKYSFHEWLQLSKLKPISRETESTGVEKIVKTSLVPENNKSGKEHKQALIDKFIVNNPKIEPIQGQLEVVPMQLKKIDTLELMTETLARVYLEQKKYAKAIQAYEILILKYPEKSSFFADRILEIKVLQQNKPQQ